MIKFITITAFVLFAFAGTPAAAENQNSIRIHAAIEKAKIVFPDLPIVVTGSIAFIGDVMEYLKIEVFK